MGDLADLLPELEPQLPVQRPTPDFPETPESSETSETSDTTEVEDERLGDPAHLPRVRIAAGVVAVIAALGAAVTILATDTGLVPSALIALTLAAGMVWRAAAPASEERPSGPLGFIIHRMELLWDNEAVSFYGIGTLATFIQLEARTLLGDFREAGGLIDFLSGEIGEYAIGFSMRSLMNSVEAAMWPVSIFTTYTVYGAVVLALTFGLWDRVHDRVDDMLRARNAALKAHADGAANEG